ncbi:dockerin type I domain-containing protein [Pseudobacteroides cellulosolvens]|uniref:Dockerin domain-containing protein n=1 Tax=Pseudobacteroides cellulosolvens ATCC 35603 = DSM 2933 TaxID=398512 RepID=A0A0L6JVF4_9FIRM|nr:dockerin type I domain-containing protein [Pseudobacteroides cellulosolvens]KNY29412.1 hypothetical protein Bccel_4686 [Pseudobacteroides cellulosolvens ATCC 35603 = DSM 2933]
MRYKCTIKKLAVSVITAVVILSTNFATPFIHTDSDYKVFGFVSTDVNSLKGGIKVDLGSTGLSTVTDQRGYFEFNKVPYGVYTLKASKKGLIKRNVTVYAYEDVMVSSSDYPVRLWVGDFNQDSSINMADVLEISKSFNSTVGDPLYISDNDLDSDGVINLKEVMLIARRFNMTSFDYANQTAQKNEITPEGIFEETGCRVFKLTDPHDCESYVLCDDEFIHIGVGFAGFGVTDIETCDFDAAGKKDLIYVYSFGSGIHRSHIGILDLDDKKETTLDYVNFDDDIMLKKISDIYFEVYDMNNTDRLLAKVGLVDGKIIVEKVI